MYRYALYFAPPRSSALWCAGIRWLGRDPESNETFETCVESGHASDWPGYTHTRWEEITKSARRYGFHATLKPPFRLAVGCAASQLRARLRAFCEQHHAVPLPPLRVAVLGDFVALRPVTECAALNTLAARCVREFEPFRAPPDEAEQARRLKVPLSPRQLDYLHTYGYPYVLDEWRFHLTLTDGLLEDQRQLVMRRLEEHFASSLEVPLAVEDIALFGQPSPQADFRLLERHALGEAMR